jgi:3-phenylpropionate/trans-cinnamate dioxygenase ferredoxin subunit
MSTTIGTTSDVAPGQMRAFDVNGRKVAVANVGGSFYAFDDTCTHQGCSLANGDLGGRTVTCACHGSEFDVTTGEVMDGPAEYPVRTWAVEVRGEELAIEG